MTVKTLKEMLKDIPDDAVVYTTIPEGGNEEENLFCFGARYIVSDNDGRVWFERYCDEEICEEVDAVADECIDSGCGDEEIVMELINPDRHGYTWPMLKNALSNDQYEWLVMTAKEHGLL